jgi:hypothetical protein
MRYRHPREIEQFDSLATRDEEVFTPHRGRRSNVKKPGFICCVKCEADFWPTGEEGRPRPLRFCPKCRGLEEAQAKFLKHRDPSPLSDVDLNRWIHQKTAEILEAA